MEHRVGQLKYVYSNYNNNFENDILDLIEEMKVLSEDYKKKYSDETSSLISNMLLQYFLIQYSDTNKGIVSKSTINSMDKLIKEYSQITLAELDENKIKFIEIENNVLPFIIIFYCYFNFYSLIDIFYYRKY